MQRRYLQAIHPRGGNLNVVDTETVNSVMVEAPTRILLAEDDPVTRMLMTRSLKKAGFEVDAVADGTAALDKMIRAATTRS
jgi:PleD family two-component response regulator